MADELWYTILLGSNHDSEVKFRILKMTDPIWRTGLLENQRIFVKFGVRFSWSADHDS